MHDQMKKNNFFFFNFFFFFFWLPDIWKSEVGRSVLTKLAYLVF